MDMGVGPSLGHIDGGTAVGKARQCLSGHHARKTAVMDVKKPRKIQEDQMNSAG